MFRFFESHRPLWSSLLALALGLACASARANIYGFIDEQGVAHFAAEKVDPRYQLFLRGKQVEEAEPAPAPLGAARPELLRYLAQHPNLKKFEPFLKAASRQFAVDPALLKAVMAAESAFKPDAVSPKGAVGLMQIMPDTAGRYGVHADKNKTVEQKLTDPETNIRLGARYLRDLSRLFPNQPELVIASYNAGEGAVRQYKNTIPPYPETRNYVQLVTRFYQLYQPAAPLALAPVKVSGQPLAALKKTPETVAKKPPENMISIAGHNGKRILMTIPGRRNIPVSPVALND